ncbi:uncharacterized protein [Spinacia oleracea]|uniref:RNase H type-1 domain-containing protein n=1 Tax=Spinacia oleracea TaxID=3562 RepID=A0ABM3R0C0_SPIOL|nr:uncharacterized protein LOC130463841 [Spinacia oleracea]
MPLFFRQAWRLKTYTKLLSARVFKAKYGDDRFDKAVSNDIPTKVSWAARGIMKSVATMNAGLRRSIGDGKTTKITGDLWVGDACINFKNNITEATIKPTWVAELITPAREWDQRRVWGLFDSTTARHILATHIQEDEFLDEWDWGLSGMGTYSTNSGYWCAQGTTTLPSPLSSFWSSWWKRKIFPKWKLFVWKIINNALPMHDCLVKRGIITLNVWSFCGSSGESTTHLFLECEVVKRVLSSGSLGIRTEGNQGIGIAVWLKNMLSYIMREDKQEEERVVELIATLWSVWLHRNECCFRATQCIPTSITKLARIWKQRWVKAFSMHGGLPSLLGEQITPCVEQAWIVGECSDEDPVVIITDGAWKKIKGREARDWDAAIGWVILYKGDTLVQGASKVFASSPAQAEALAILTAFKNILSLARNIIVWTDSIQIVHALHDEASSPMECKPVIRDIKKQTLSFVYCKIVKVKKLFVLRAHNLAVTVRKVP